MSIEQAGIYKITLKENKDAVITYSGSTITIATTGQTIELANDQNIKLTYRPERSANNKQLYRYSLSWVIYDLSKDNLTYLNQLKQSIYGWLIEIEFYNGNKKAITSPLRFISSNIDNNLSNSYLVNISNPVLGDKLIEITTTIEGEEFLLAEDGQNLLTESGDFYIVETLNFLLAEDGEFLETEGGELIILE